MALSYSYPSLGAAIAALEVEGFTPTAPGSGYWRKASSLHDGTPCVALTSVNERVVSPEYGKPNYFTVDFI